MSISFSCPSCQKKLKAPDKASGKKSTCPKCRNPVTIPVLAPNLESIDDLPQGASKWREQEKQTPPTIFPEPPSKAKREESVTFPDQNSNDFGIFERATTSKGNSGTDPPFREFPDDLPEIEVEVIVPPMPEQESNDGIPPKKRKESLTECQDCGAMVSIRAYSCPNCGCPFEGEGGYSQTQKKSEKGGGGSCVGTLLALIGLLVGIYFWLFFDTTVETFGFGRVHNVGRLNQRIVGVVAGLGCLGLGILLDVIGRSRKR